MAHTTLYLTGMCEWAKVHDPDTKFNSEGVYTVNLYPDDKSQELFDKAGLRLKKKNGTNGQPFYSFRRVHSVLRNGEVVIYGRPAVFKDGEQFDGKIGNGSVVTLKVEVYDTAKGIGHRLAAVRVDELVAYDDVLKADDTVPF